MNEHKRRKQVDGQWPCGKCKKYKDASEFHKNAGSWNGVEAQCKECRAHRNLNPETRAKIWEFCIEKHYGLSKEDYYKLFDAQNGVCAICFKVNSSGRKLNVDHCHSTGKIRGLLCANCNTALGLLKDDKELFLNALNYLDNII